MVLAGFSEMNYELDTEHQPASGQVPRETKDKSGVRGKRRTVEECTGEGKAQ